MALTKTPVCDHGLSAPDFLLTDATSGKQYALQDCRGENGTLIMFICNHCPYVQGVLERLVADCEQLQQIGVNSVAIMPNDFQSHPEDAPEKMRALAQKMHFPFPYLLDKTQQVALAYGAVCTPDFFGYDRELKLQYRGRLDEYGKDPAPARGRRILVEAMRQIADSGTCTEEQFPSMGCSIKWTT